MNKEECMNCEWYGKPYWSIINPCDNCNKRFNNKQVKNIKYSINFDKKELYKEIEQLQQENKQLKNNWNKLKKWTKHERKVAVGMQNGYGIALCGCMINKMQELEKGDSNE